MFGAFGESCKNKASVANFLRIPLALADGYVKAYANAAFDSKLTITPSEESSDSFESLFGKLYMENNKYE